MKKGYIYIVLATFFFSTMEIALKKFSLGFNPIQMNFIRFFIGALLIMPLAIKNIKQWKIRLKREDFIFFALTGFICVVVSMTLYQLAVLEAKASIVAILFSCNPVFVIPLAFFLLKEKITKSTVISLAISVLGMITIMNPFQLSSSVSGIILSLLAAATFALYGVVGKLKSQKYGGVVLSFFSFLMGSIELLFLMLASKIPIIAGGLRHAGFSEFADIPVFQGITLQSLPGLIYIGIFVTGLGYTCYFLAMEKASVAKASLVFFIKPALAPVLAFIVLREPITENMILGILLIVLGSLITFRAGGADKKPLMKKHLKLRTQE